MCVQSANGEYSITFTFIKDLMDCIHRDLAVSAKLFRQCNDSTHSLLGELSFV